MGNFEGGIRVPAAIGGGWAAVAPLRGRRSSDLAHISDWYATLCHAAGVSATDGRSSLVASVDSRSLWRAWLGTRLRPSEGFAGGSADGSAPTALPAGCF